MKTILIYSPKGGCGKTTLTRELAVAAGDDVAICDLDPQHSLTDWSEAREAPRPALVEFNADRPSKGIKRIAGAGADFLFIDSPPRSSADMAPLIAAVDAVLVPVRPTPDDIRPAGEIAARLNEARTPWCFVLTQCATRARLTDQAARRLASIGLVAPINIGFRQDFPTAAIDGLSAFEMNGKASTEITDLLTYVTTSLTGADHGKKAVA